jgi:DNA-binding transcriptional ArsR family regulator
MGTIEDALFSRTRAAVLAVLFGHPDERFHVRAIVRAAKVGSGSVQRELETLAGAGLVERIAEGRQVYYRANARSPVYPELCALVAKTIGIGGVVRDALEPLAGQIRVAFIYGSGARGELTSGSDVDVLVIGAVAFGDVVEAFHETHTRLGREVNPSVFTPAEWAQRLRRGDHLASAVMHGDKLFVIGDEHELAGVGGEPVADAPSHES